MSKLPTNPLATDSVTINGTEVTFRALSRAEAIKLNGYTGREDEAELYVIERGTGCTPEEAQAFYTGNDTATAGLLIDGILILSGLAQRGEDGVVRPMDPLAQRTPSPDS